MKGKKLFVESFRMRLFVVHEFVNIKLKAIQFYIVNRFQLKNFSLIFICFFFAINACARRFDEYKKFIDKMRKKYEFPKKKRNDCCIERCCGGYCVSHFNVIHDTVESMAAVMVNSKEFQIKFQMRKIEKDNSFDPIENEMKNSIECQIFPWQISQINTNCFNSEVLVYSEKYGDR